MTRPFASTLPTSGFLALGNAGFRPLRQVQGTSIVNLGVQRRPSRWMRGSLAPMRLEFPAGYGASTTSVYYPRGSLAVQQYLNEGGWFELEERTAAYNDARQHALKRLRESAAETGALAVVDVRIRRGKFAQALGAAIEFTALGTAIGSDRYDLDDSASIPLVSLTGGDFWKLVASGIWPLGLVGGTSVGYVVSGYRTKFARFRFSRRSLWNQEYEDYTRGFMDARLHAAGRLRLEAEAVGATGVVGIEVGRERRHQSDDNLLVTVDMLGNAIAPIEQGAPAEVTYALGLGKA
jgi:uncharacterized protein YbjQ (UPF0145 family)